MVNEMVHAAGVRTIEDNQSWRFGEQPAGVLSVTLDLSKFEKASKELKDKMLTGVSDDSAVAYIKSGTPLKLNSTSGLYEPHAEADTEPVAGLVESMIEVSIGFNGWVAAVEQVGMRYRGDIVLANLPVTVASTATWEGDFVAVDPTTGSAKRLLNTAPTTAATK